MNILLTGDLEHISSHVDVTEIKNGLKVTIIDNLSNSKIDALDRLKLIAGDSIRFFKTMFVIKFFSRH